MKPRQLPWFRRKCFEISVISTARVSRDWKTYLIKARIDENEVAVANDSALKLVQRAEKRLTSLIFNNEKEVNLFDF